MNTSYRLGLTIIRTANNTSHKVVNFMETQSFVIKQGRACVCPTCAAKRDDSDCRQREAVGHLGVKHALPDVAHGDKGEHNKWQRVAERDAGIQREHLQRRGARTDNIIIHHKLGDERA